ncbi:virulence factor TspB C-terminal domain-related protein [Acinetobacter johnsonii]|uniref:virulence factor TspB C-terminal domain-related protein n=1 Tax=Acinetobacter johnsonii TaxID=40214 RepID=UPI002FDB3C5B|nr:virulence factor TspB C-terminal domain-related protein [Acinetobacter johnsonii]
MKKIITFLLSLIIAYSPIYVFAGAAERQESIYDAAMKSRNGIGVSNVRAANDMINADITQRVTVDGSNATINTKVSIPANDDTFARKTASHAKNLLRGGAWAAGAAVAMDVVLDGVGWVIDEGGKITKRADFYVPIKETTTCAKGWGFGPNNLPLSSLIQDYVKNNSRIAGQTGRDYYSSEIVGCNGLSNVVVEFKYKYCTSNCSPSNARTQAEDKTERKAFVPSTTNNPPSEPSRSPVSDGEIEDAFYNWMKNNPQSITDPVTTYIYSPKDSQGNALPKSPEGTDPSFGPNEITDEMMNNYMEHRNANLQNPYTTTIGDSTQTDTTQNPEGTKTNTKTNPDGSKTETKTDTKVNPDTGEITTTVTETTTNPDGSTSTKTETSTQTKPKPETTDLPAFCDYAASLCTWMNRDTDHKADEKSLWEKITDWFDWTKEEPDSDNSDNEVDTKEPEKFDTAVFKKDRFNVSKSCPVAETHTITLSGISVDFSFDLTPICTVLEFARPALVACSYLYAAYIVIGAARIG